MANPNNVLASPTDTIFALSSGAPPAAIAIIRISGPEAGDILDGIAGHRPEPRMAALRTLRDGTGEMLDRALTLWLPGPTNATGEDLAELHLHGGRAVIDAVSADLRRRGVRMAEPGEFTRRALFNGRLDLSEVEGLADLLAAETEAQRREALHRSSGALARRLKQWAMDLTAIAAIVEAEIDYDGEVTPGGQDVPALIDALAGDIARALKVPPAERLRDGIRVAISGPPNAGKSSLFNALLGTDAAIVSPIAGTTRDAIERPVSIAGMPFVLVDTAGDRETDDPIERIGVQRARQERTKADIIVDLVAQRSEGQVIAVSAKADIESTRPATIGVSAMTGLGLDGLLDAVVQLGRQHLPGPTDIALDRRYREGLEKIAAELVEASRSDDPLLTAEHLRMAREDMDRLTGEAGIEDVLDALFGRFCLGK